MCGITGYIADNVDRGDLLNSVQSIKHRGPNNQSIWQDKGVGLGHARLSILDLSDAANQPMISACNKYMMVFNGEIYNFKSLRKKYQIQTKTSSDSEVILELFIKKGPDFVQELNGMFAISIYNKVTKELFLFRDRLGIKPLYYYLENDTLFFASELKALLSYSKIAKCKSLNKLVISQFLSLGYIAEPNTIFNHIYKFPSGSYMKFSNGVKSFVNYWSVEDKLKEQTITNKKDAIKQLTDGIQKSVEKRLLSDVPLGTFLSGGIDSSLITAVAQSISNQPVKTFSIGFKESKFNESEYARKVSQYLKTDHHEYIVSETDVLEMFDDYFFAYDEPFADASGFPTMVVSKLAKRDVSVILSGDGGDELFHGYGMYTWAKRLNNPLLSTLRKPLSMGLSMLDNRSKRAALVINYKNRKFLKQHIFSQEQYYFSQQELYKTLPNQSFINLKENVESIRKLSSAESQSLFDIKNYLKDDLLVKVDRASMLSALEVRVPFLDHEFVELAINVDSILKTNKGQQKAILKEVLYEFLPKSYFDRPKWGFGIPLERWLRTDLLFLLNKYISKNMLDTYGLVNTDYVLNLKQRYLNGESYLYNRLWLIIVLHIYVESYNFSE
jgi:asparagine synthase (glutamine-hydrolysing)